MVPVLSDDQYIRGSEARQVWLAAFLASTRVWQAGVRQYSWAALTAVWPDMQLWTGSQL
jgi:hypothetical protein